MDKSTFSCEIQEHFAFKMSSTNSIAVIGFQETTSQLFCTAVFHLNRTSISFLWIAKKTYVQKTGPIG